MFLVHPARFQLPHDALLDLYSDERQGNAKDSAKETSVGKCTNRYRRLKPMSAAAIITQIPDFLKYRRIEVAAAKAHAVCVDGQE